MVHPMDRLFVGIDWGAYEHRACVVDVSGKVLGERSVPHGGEGIAALVAWLDQLVEGIPSRAWAAIEMPHGPVVETLLDRGFVVHSINPKQLDRFRDRFTVAGAKDDRRDARVLADSLRSDPACYRPLSVEDPLVVELREWSRIGEENQRGRVRETNRFGQQLRRYFPQALDVTADIGADWFLDLWEAVPTPARAARVREATIAKILKAHRIRKVTAAQVLEILRRVPVHVAPGVIDAATGHVHQLVKRLRLINEQLRESRCKLEALCNQLSEADGETKERCEQPDAVILRSMPGIGLITCAVLLAEAGSALRERDYQGLRKRCGIAPVTHQSGTRRGVRMRHACNTRLRVAVYHWARTATQHDAHAKAHYAALRARGHTHGRALRGVADRLLNVLCAALRKSRTYDPGLRRAA
jgi:endonuclease III